MSGLFRSTVIPGNKLTDFAATTAQVGIPIPFGYGEYVVAGNILWAALPPKENVTRRRQGKGGVKTETYTYTLSYAVSFGSPISSYKWIERQGKIVYTTDPNAPVEDKEYAQKWLQRATIHLGGSNQLPDSTIEAVEGSGQVSAFKHLTYIVLEEEDLTENGGAPPNYRACCYRGAAKSYTTPPYPIHYVDKVESTGNAQSGSIYEFPMDELLSLSYALNGQLRDILQPYYAEPDELLTSSFAMDGVLRTPLVIYNSPPEAVDASSYALDGTLRTVLLTYANYEPEAVDASSYALDGTLTP